MRALLLRGMLSGVCAGVRALAFAVVVGKPAIDRAIAFAQASATEHEQANADSDDATAEAEPVSRGVQRGVGLAGGLLALGAAFGGIVAVVFTAARGASARSRTAQARCSWRCSPFARSTYCRS